MTSFGRLKLAFGRFLEVQSSDPDDARQRRILNIILSLMGALGFITLFLGSALVLTGVLPMKDAPSILTPSFSMALGSTVIYIINRYRSGVIAGTLFILLVMFAIFFADSYTELSVGRSVFLFVLPIIVSSFLLGSRSTFVFYILSSIELAIVNALAGGKAYDPFFSYVAFFLVAFISWLSSRGLEQALRDLRQINAELDQRVEERTRELSAALARELAEAGRSQAILEGIADGVVVFDPNGRSIVVNPSLVLLLDLSVDQLKGVTMETILEIGRVSPQERGTILAMLGNPSMDKSSVRLRWGRRTLLVNAAQVVTGLGALIGTVAVFRDFTHEAEIEQMKSTFVGMVSHELRTPLNAIIGYAEMMRETVYGPIAPRQVSIMERIENSSRRLLALVSDLLDQAQIEAGRMKIHNAEFKLADLLESARSLMDKQIADKGLILKISIMPDMPALVMGDAQRLQQIFLNLIGNAAKFTVRGEIGVHVYRASESHWGFRVSDTGPGIPSEAQEYVFDTFRQVEGVTTREHGGIGLGLAIVKSLVGLMGGQIKLSSEIGRGTTFTVMLPFEPPKEKP
jgi:signal transduction histidine kinase